MTLVRRIPQALCRALAVRLRLGTPSAPVLCADSSLPPRAVGLPPLLRPGSAKSAGSPPPLMRYLVLLAVRGPLPPLRDLPARRRHLSRVIPPALLLCADSYLPPEASLHATPLSPGKSKSAGLPSASRVIHRACADDSSDTTPRQTNQKSERW